jgi:predicted nucleic acid-binding protein
MVMECQGWRIELQQMSRKSVDVNCEQMRSMASVKLLAGSVAAGRGRKAENPSGDRKRDPDKGQRARQVQRMLATRSRHGRKVPDLLVGAAAEDAGLVVLHYDSNFDRIAAVTGQKCEWVIAPGSID